MNLKTKFKFIFKESNITEVLDYHKFKSIKIITIFNKFINDIKHEGFKDIFDIKNNINNYEIEDFVTGSNKYTLKDIRKDWYYGQNPGGESVPHYDDY
jgi:hypothetical protein